MPNEHKAYVAILDGLPAFPFDILKFLANQEWAEELWFKQ